MDLVYEITDVVGNSKGRIGILAKYIRYSIVSKFLSMAVAIEWVCYPFVLNNDYNHGMDVCP